YLMPASCALVLLCAFLAPRTPPSHRYTLSLHDALPIFGVGTRGFRLFGPLLLGLGLNSLFKPASQGHLFRQSCAPGEEPHVLARSEEHTSELQSRENLVCRLLLEKKKRSINNHTNLRHT